MGVCCQQGEVNASEAHFIEETPRLVEIESLENLDRTTKARAYQEVTEVWAKYDEDKSGKLEYVEAEKFLDDCLTKMFGRKPSKEEIETHFKQIDTDGSGDLDKEEAMVFLLDFKKAIASLQKLRSSNTTYENNMMRRTVRNQKTL